MCCSLPEYSFTSANAFSWRFKPWNSSQKALDYLEQQSYDIRFNFETNTKLCLLYIIFEHLGRWYLQKASQENLFPPPAVGEMELIPKISTSPSLFTNTLWLPVTCRQLPGGPTRHLSHSLPSPSPPATATELYSSRLYVDVAWDSDAFCSEYASFLTFAVAPLRRPRASWRPSSTWAATRMWRRRRSWLGACFPSTRA